MKTFIKLFTVIVLISALGFFIAQNNSETKQFTEPNVEHYHIIIGIDLSGTTKGNGWPIPNKEFFLQVVSFIEDKNGGVLEIFNFSDAIPQPIRVIIEPLEEEPSVYEVDEFKKVRQKNQIITSKNKLSKERFIANIEEKIIEFRPKPGNDFTYVNLNCNAISRSFSLPQYSINTTSLCMIYSDLIDHTPRSKPKLVEEEVLGKITSYAHLSLCNYGKLEPDVSLIKLPSYTDFIGLLNTYSQTRKNNQK